MTQYIYHDQSNQAVCSKLMDDGYMDEDEDDDDDDDDDDAEEECHQFWHSLTVSKISSNN